MSIQYGFDKWAMYSKWHFWQNSYHSDPDLFVLDEDLWYTSKNGSRFRVQTGFLTDLGSIPRPLWPILPRDRWPSAFILHDYLCEQDWIPRLDADKILREALLASGAGWLEAEAIYRFVRFYVRVIKPIEKVWKKVKAAL